MSKFDEILKQELDNISPIDSDQNETVLEMTAQVFRSKIRWVFILYLVEGLIIGLVVIWAGIRMYHAQEFKPLIVYATVLIACGVSGSMIQTIHWQLINKYSIMREIKRLELRIAEINETKSD